jgi:hypothetical protein
MWLQVPDSPGSVLWEGPLESAREDTVERISRGQGPRKDKEDASDMIRDLPIVSIGQPEIWRMAEVYPTDKISPALRAQASEADFYLARFSCSFRPVRKESAVEWARFLVRLLPDHLDRQPIAYDLYPREVMYEVKRDVKVSLGPTLKFAEVEAKLGEVAFGLEYQELQPEISAAGIGEATPSWDYRETKGVKVLGSKWMHLLIKAPRGMEAVRATLDLAADVWVKGWRLPVVILRNKEAHANLTVRLV